jgi:hypothetical protein
MNDVVQLACPECNLDFNLEVEIWEEISEETCRKCPHCGARMAAPFDGCVEVSWEAPPEKLVDVSHVRFL